MAADQRGPGRRSQVYISSGSLCSAAQMLDQKMWRKFRQVPPDKLVFFCWMYKDSADSTPCLFNVTSKQAGGWESAHWLWLARGGPDYFTDHHPDQQGGAGHSFQSGHLWGSQCRQSPGPDAIRTHDRRFSGQSFCWDDLTVSDIHWLNMFDQLQIEPIKSVCCWLTGGRLQWINRWPESLCSCFSRRAAIRKRQWRCLWRATKRNNK